MSGTFDPRAIAKGINRRKLVEEAASLRDRLIDCKHHEKLYAVFGDLAGVSGHPNKKPAIKIDEPTSVYVYGRDGKKNLKIKHTLDSAAIRFHFPAGLTVTKLRAVPLTYRLGDADGRQLVVRRRRASRKDPLHWEVMGLPFGFSERRGLHAGQRLRGHGPVQSFE